MLISNSIYTLLLYIIPINLKKYTELSMEIGSFALVCFVWTILKINCKFDWFCLSTLRLFNTLRPRRNEQCFTEDIFKRIFFNENVWISIQISPKFVPKGRINYIPALVLIMAWCRSGDKPLSEPMMVSLPMHICVTRSQWVKSTSAII